MSLGICVQSPTLLSGFRIWCCCGCGLGYRGSFESTPRPGISTCYRFSSKKKKKCISLAEHLIDYLIEHGSLKYLACKSFGSYFTNLYKYSLCLLKRVEIDCDAIFVMIRQAKVPEKSTLLINRYSNCKKKYNWLGMNSESLVSS